MKPLQKLNGIVTELPRGGYLVDSPEGYIQFGAPPETIKDTMNLPGSVPEVFVLPRELFNWKKGINLSDMEFPIYYNYFFRNKKTLIICQREQAGRLIRALQEALFGPKDLIISEDILRLENKNGYPDLQREFDHFRGGLHFRNVLTLGVFQDNRYELGKVTIVQDSSGGFEVLWGSRKAAHVPCMMAYTPTYAIGKRLPEPYQPPLFGVTCLGPSHGFDPKENTSGFIIWMNHSGIMIDPPVNSTEWLEDSNVNPKLIDSILLTHCHADHDAGTLQKILEEGKVTVYTTKTVMRSFLKKYSSLTNEPVTYLAQLFDFHPIYIGKPVFIHGGEFNFRYMLHSIPTIGFTLKFQDQTFVYSSDHQGSPTVQKELLEGGVISRERYLELQEFPWDSKVIYHEAGIPPLHTPVSFLNSLPRKVQEKTVVYHIAKKDFPRKTGLTLATFGIENTLYLKTRVPAYEKTYQILEVLKHLDFFDSLSMEKAQEFVSIVEERHFKKGEKILHKGRPGRNFYIILSGNVAIRGEKLLDKKILGTYEYFGEVALLTENARTADVVAETDVRVYTIAKAKFLSFIYATDFERTLRRLIKIRSSETWNIFATSPVFQQLTTYQRTWLESILTPVERPGSGELVKENKSLEQIFIIRSGEVRVSRKGEQLAVLKTGEFIGSLHRLQRDALAQYTYSYDDDLTLFAIRRSDALDFLDKNPGLGMKLAQDY
jgi:CRP-like cAMP-binding protein